MNEQILEDLERRLGQNHARERLAIEDVHHQKVFGDGLNFFHPENWYSFHSWIRYCLKLSGLYARGQRNSRRILVRHNTITVPHLPHEFVDFRILHISDPHADMDVDAMDALISAVTEIDYDICVLTGDYRARTSGPFSQTLAEMSRLMEVINSSTYGVLGNHDSIRMVPGLEEMGINMLINETESIELNGMRIHLSGIDDAHYFQVDDIELAARDIPENEVSILLSHTPEIYKRAADAHYDLLFCGHTHGGQICLPGGIPITLDANCPRSIGAGHWKYGSLTGYTSSGAGTSIVNVRINCPPEVAVHRLVQRQPTTTP